MPSNATLKVVIQAVDNASATLKKIGGQVGGLQNLGNKAKMVGQQFSGMGQRMQTTSLAVGAGIGFAMRAGIQFSTTMANVQAVSGATEKQFETLRKQAKMLGETTKFSAVQAGEAQQFLAMAGNDVNTIMGAMPHTLRLAAAAQLDMGSSADIVTNIMAGFGQEADQLGHAVDVLAKTFTNSNTDLVQLGEAMKYVGPIASAAGVSFEETAAAAGLLGNAGIQASMAGTSLRGSITRLLNPSNKALGVMENLGLSVIDAEGQFIGFTGVVRQLEKAQAELGEGAEFTGMLMEIFGQRAGPAMAALVGQGSEELARMTALLEESGGTAERIAETQMKGLHGQITLMKSAMEGAAISLTEALAPALTVLANGLRNAANWFSNLSPWLQKTIGAVLVLTAVAAPLLLILGGAISVLGGLVTVLAAVSAPVWLVIAAVVALIAIGYQLVQRWDKFKEALLAVWGIIAQGFSYKLELIKAAWASMWGNIKDTAAGFIQGIKDAVFGLVDSIKAKITGALGMLKAAKDKVAGFIGGVGSKIGGAVSSVGSAIGFSQGGVVPQYLASGGFARPSGTDTVPAMLTPGELVLNAGQQRGLANRLSGSGEIKISLFEGANVEIRDEGDEDRLVDKVTRALTRTIQLHNLGAA